MLTLYVRPGCPYCHKVLRAGAELGVEFALKESTDPAAVAELVARGGKAQYPYLVDDGRGVEMYESDDIIDHLHENFAQGA
jgi:glutaredoxin